jgi:hypothetical protein
MPNFNVPIKEDFLVELAEWYLKIFPKNGDKRLGSSIDNLSAKSISRSCPERNGKEYAIYSAIWAKYI